MKPDWVIILIPTSAALRTFSGTASLLALGALFAIAAIRKPGGKFETQFGPFVLLLISSVVVFARPVSVAALLTFALLTALTFILVRTVDARRIVASLIDGCGLYLLSNIMCYAAGIQSPSSAIRIGGLTESTGFVRIIFPLTQSINIPPIIAAVYVAGFLFTIRDAGMARRALRLACLAAAIIVFAGSGTRAPIVSAVLVSSIAIFAPYIARWMVQAATVAAAISAAILPSLITSVIFLIQPLVSLATGRQERSGSIATIQGRDYIWDRSITYWLDWVNDPFHILLGYGASGQYKSGASLSYSDALANLVRNPERAYTHNAFLQQLFDGGALGWLLLAVATYWTGARLSRRRYSWGRWAAGGTAALTVLVVSAMTEVSIAPGPALEGYWVLMILVGVGCQKDKEHLST